MPLDPEPIKDILYRTTARYLTVRPQGFEIAGRPVPLVIARILAFGNARTLYQARKPDCRSLDGIRSTKDRICAQCPDLAACTPQVRLDLLIEGQPYRLLLSYTSAKHFLLYVATLGSSGRKVNDVQTIIEVVDRATWGELHFRAGS